MKIICSSCRYIGESATLTKGSRRKEVILWCCLVLPGLLYTLWRQSSDGRYTGCPQCQSGDVRALRKREWKHYEKTGQLPQ